MNSILLIFTLIAGGLGKIVPSNKLEISENLLEFWPNLKESNVLAKVNPTVVSDSNTINIFLISEPNYQFKDLHKDCSVNTECSTPYSECIDRKCQCQDGYVEHDQVCYGLTGSKCDLSVDCALICNSCKSGTCTWESNTKDGELYSKKPGATAIWGPYLDDDIKYYDYHLGEPNYRNREETGNLAWVQNYTLDKVALWHGYGNRKNLLVTCRVTLRNGTYVPGRVEFPGDGECKIDVKGVDLKSTNNYLVLVDLG